MNDARNDPNREPAPWEASGTLVGQLLSFVATSKPLSRRTRHFAWRAEGSDERQFRWVVEGGLGPMLLRAARLSDAPVPAAWHDTLSGADLAARVRHAQSVESALDVIEVCQRLETPVTLLKGISVSEALYPQEHLRPMTDIDVLIPPNAYAAIEAELLALGHERLDFPDEGGWHHGAPLFHPRRRTVIELHRELFPDWSDLRCGSMFSTPQLAHRSIESSYHGRPVRRLAPEIQLAYIAASWINDLIHGQVHPSYLATLLDCIMLLRAHGSEYETGAARPQDDGHTSHLDWQDLPAWMDNEMVRASVHATLSYLHRRGLRSVPAPTLTWLASSQRLLGPVQTRLFHATLDRYLVGGRPWDHALPPPMPARYSPLQQLRKRLRSE